MSRYEQIIFMQAHDTEGDEYTPLSIYQEDGAGAAIDYLTQWHYPGEHQTADEPGAGTSDTVHHGHDDEPGQTMNRAGYILTVNSGLDYIGLEFDTEYQEDIK